MSNELAAVTDTVRVDSSAEALARNGQQRNEQLEAY
jgi:hypothetical protein